MKDWSQLRVLVTGGTGFLGHHLVLALKNAGVRELAVVGSRDYDLTQQDQVQKMFATFKPEVVFHLAGLVGGILANQQRPADFFYQNLMMGTLVMHQASQMGVKKFLAAGAGCGYPETAPMPLREADLWSGFPQKESAPYSLAKRLLPIQAQAYHQQYGFNAVTCIPGNIYGEHDCFELQRSHVIPALVRKFVEAARNRAEAVEVWGDGSPTRDFVYAGDVARGMIRALEVCDKPEVINLSAGKETSIRTVCELLQKITDFRGQIRWNTDRPSGQSRRLFDVSLAKSRLGFEATTSLETGLRKTAEWFANSGEART